LNIDKISYAIVIIPILAFVIFLTFIIFRKRSRHARVRRNLKRRNKQIRNIIFSGEFVPYQEFMDNWISERTDQGNAGFKYNDGPGCYVILVFDEDNDSDDLNDYDDVYVGQSVNVCKRVHNHFTGKGNGNIFADIRAGRDVYVGITRCDETELNDMEIDLIRAFHATTSYNNTKGGGTRRE